MEFKSISILSNDIDALGKYYCELFNKDPQEATENFQSFVVGHAQLNIWNKQEFYRVLNKDLQTDIVLNANNSGHVSPHLVCFFVNDINAERDRISRLGYVIIKGVTTQRWGNTSFWIRDPEGNIINFIQK
jgi:predicted enzyme related to lactoylglutathione lyase